MSRSALLPWLLVLLPACGGGGGGATPGGGGGPVGACTLTTPAAFASGLTGSLTLTASADGTPAKVRFFLDGTLLAEDTTAPYSATIPDTGAHASGQHVLGAEAVDGGGGVSARSQVVVSFGGTVNRPAGFTLTALAGTVSNATAMAVAPDGRIFICEQGGTLRVHKAGSLLTTPFATLPTSLNGERGLLGVAFDPAFAATGYVYVHYTALSPAPHNRISRLTADPANPDVALAGSEVPLVDLPTLSSATNHNGGALHFAPDGTLLVGVGDNANSANAPDLNSPLGKLLRFNADGTIPTDNPFYSQTTGLARATWAKGLRNPFTFGFSSGGTLHLNDVGQSTWEEVNLGIPGADYGWPATEGATTAAGVTSPLFAYGHPSAPAGQPGSTGTFLKGVSVVGAAFLPTGAPWPAQYQGDYVFADYTGGWVARRRASGEVAVLALTGGATVDLALATDGSLLILGRSGIQRLTPP